jgi:alpha-mannosidase
MLPPSLTFNNVKFELAAAHTGAPNAITAKGQTIKLPLGKFNRVYLLAASADGDQNAAFIVGGKTINLDIQDWGGFIGQWDDRQWSSTKLDVDHAKYGEMTGLKPGYIKRADLAWYCSHHHDATGQNVTYSYSYLYGYAIDLPAGATSITLPSNNKIRILAMSVADENPQVHAVHPLYDVLPSSSAKPGSTLPYLTQSAHPPI